MKISIKLPPPAVLARPAKAPKRLPGEKYPFKEMTSSARNLVPPQTWDGKSIISSRAHEVSRESSINEKFQEFLAGEARQREALHRQLRFANYLEKFLLNVMTAE